MAKTKNSPLVGRHHMLFIFVCVDSTLQIEEMLRLMVGKHLFVSRSLDISGKNFDSP